jgi:hypothetical protein
MGVEVFYTGSQRLDDNPYRTESIPYWIFGFLAERHIAPCACSSTLRISGIRNRHAMTSLCDRNGIRTAVGPWMRGHLWKAGP